MRPPVRAPRAAWIRAAHHEDVATHPRRGGEPNVSPQHHHVPVNPAGDLDRTIQAATSARASPSTITSRPTATSCCRLTAPGSSRNAGFFWGCWAAAGAASRRAREVRRIRTVEYYAR